MCGVFSVEENLRVSPHGQEVFSREEMTEEKGTFALVISDQRDAQKPLNLCLRTVKRFLK